MKIVDTKGQLCPAPIIATRRALNELPSGESFIVQTDNQTSFNNLSRFLKDNNTEFKANESGGVWNLIITKAAGGLISPDAEKFCTPEIAHFQKGNYIIAITSDKMGEGDEVLGKLLITNFIKALKDLEKLPQKMVFYNRGVMLATDTSPVIDHLKDLEKMGVELLLCATCVDHYSLGTKISTGTLSNMYSIAETMASAGNIIRP